MQAPVEFFSGNTFLHERSYTLSTFLDIIYNLSFSLYCTESDDWCFVPVVSVPCHSFDVVFFY